MGVLTITACYEIKKKKQQNRLKADLVSNMLVAIKTFTFVPVNLASKMKL